MLNKFTAAMRDMADSTQIATAEEERWLRNLWHGSLHRDNLSEAERVKRMQWLTVARDVCVVAMVVGVMTWLGARG